jgi:hypothetical protein
MRFYWLLIGTLAVWRITHLLTAEDGPWNLVVWVRRKAGAGFWGNLLDCFYCLSLWISAPFAFFLGAGVKERICLWLALSAGAIILNRVNAKDPVIPAYFEHGGQEDVLLRKSESSSDSDGQTGEVSPGGGPGTVHTRDLGSGG